MQRARCIAQLARFATKSQYLRVRAKHKENSGKDCALNNGARNSAQWIARFAAERSGAFKADEAEHGEYQRGTERRKSDTAQPELVHVEMKSEMDRHHCKDNAD